MATPTCNFKPGSRLALDVLAVAKAVLLPVGVPPVEAPAVAPLEAPLEELLVLAAEVVMAATIVVAFEVATAVTFAQPLVKSIAISPMKQNCQF